MVDCSGAGGGTLPGAGPQSHAGTSVLHAGTSVLHAGSSVLHAGSSVLPRLTALALLLAPVLLLCLAPAAKAAVLPGWSTLSTPLQRSARPCAEGVFGDAGVVVAGRSLMLTKASQVLPMPSTTDLSMFTRVNLSPAKLIVG